MSDTNKSEEKTQINPAAYSMQTLEDEMLITDFDTILSMRGIVKAVSMCFPINDQEVYEAILNSESIDAFLLWMDTATGSPHEVALLKGNFYSAMKYAFDEMKPKLFAGRVGSLKI